MADLHRGVTVEVVDQQGAEGFTLALARTQNSKTDIGYSLHVAPTMFTSSGLQRNDLLAYMGFRRSACSFLNRDCYARPVDVPFDTAGVAAALPCAYAAIDQADRHLAGCGVLLNHPEGFGYFWHKPSQPAQRPSPYPAGDGHTGEEHRRLGQGEDANFHFALTFLTSGRTKGWITHYQPKHEPISSEMLSAFAFLGLRSFHDCPEFGFEQCHWRYTSYESDDWTRTNLTHAQFKAHSEQFSAGLEALLRANVEVAPFGLSFLPAPRAQQAPTIEVPTAAAMSTAAGTVVVKTAPDYEFDVALSFAGPQRALAERVARLVRDADFRVFYDDFYPEQLWGKNLVEFFDKVYRKQSRYCLMFISSEYRDRMWTTHERQSAQARALAEKGNDYILPVMVEEIELPGLPPTLGHLSLQHYSIEEIANLLIKRLQSTGA